MYVYIICVQVTTQTAAISLGGQSSESPQPTASVPTHIPAGELHYAHTYHKYVNCTVEKSGINLMSIVIRM